MTKEELSRGIQEIDADLVAEAAFDAHTPESGRAEEPTRILVARKRRSGLRAVGLLAAALAVVVAVSAIVAWKPFSRHKPADEAKLSGDGCGALYQMTAHETVRVEGSGFSEDWLPVYVQSQAGTVAAAVRAEYGITGEVRICTKGFSRAALGKQNVLNRDSVFLPITRDGTIIGALEVFRADGKPGSSVALGGDVWASWNRVFAEHPDEDLVFVLAGGAVDTAITKDNRVLEISEGGGRFLDAGEDWYDLLKTEYNVFSAKELTRSDRTISVNVSADSFTVEGSQSFQAVVEEINGNVILVREVDSEQSGSEQNETASKEYWLTVSEETGITRNGEQIELSALKQNDDVFVFYSGEVLETYPMQIPHVSEIMLYQGTAHEAVRVEGSGFSEEELREYVQSQAGTIAAAVRAEYGITGEIRVCTKGFSRAALSNHQNVLNRDSVFLPITKDGRIIGALEVFRADGKPGSSVALGGDGWERWNKLFDEHPDEDLVFVLACGEIDTAIAPNNGVLEIGEGGAGHMDAGVNWYSLLKTEYNVFSAKELTRSDRTISVTVSPNSFTVEGSQSFQAVVEEISGNVILVREVDSEQSGSEQNETASKEYRLTVSEETGITRSGEQIELSALEPDDNVLIFYSGEVLETYPMQIPRVSEIRLLEAPEGLRLDRCKLYLTVLEDLWADDPALNSGVKQIGMDLSKLSHLTWEERDYVIRTFARQHGLPCVTGTWEELCDRGLIDRENLYWADGIFLSIETDETAEWNLWAIPVGAAEPELTAFNAEKWRSGLGAIFWNNCTGQRKEDGNWTYTVGQYAIS